MFPVETIEKILSFCDGKTLCCARKVDPIWQKCVEYLTRKTAIWKYCCSEDIPRNELIEYVEKISECNGHDMWLHIYENWLAWQSIETNIRFDLMHCLAEIARITCISTSGRFAAVGFEDGKVKLFNSHWDLLGVERHLGVKVTEIQFICDENKDYLENILYMAITYKSNTMYIVDFNAKNLEPVIIHDVVLHSIYKTHACILKRGGRISIMKLTCDLEMKALKVVEISYVRVYSPNEVTSVNMWNGICTFLFNSDVKTLRYDQNVQPVSTVYNKTKLHFCVKNNFKLQRSCQIIRDNIILALSSDDTNLQVLEIFLLEDKKYSKKMFNTWAVLKANITCMFMYGNAFVIGVDTGYVYFYHVSSWKKFDIRNYDSKIMVGKHPIISIDVKELKGERKFFVASKVNVQELAGFTVCKDL